MEQELLRREVALEAIKEASPDICGDAVAARHPGLEAGVVTVEALDIT